VHAEHPAAVGDSQWRQFRGIGVDVLGHPVFEVAVEGVVGKGGLGPIELV
jgi:hypothetical protein